MSKLIIAVFMVLPINWPSKWAPDCMWQALKEVSLQLECSDSHTAWLGTNFKSELNWLKAVYKDTKDCPSIIQIELLPNDAEMIAAFCYNLAELYGAKANLEPHHRDFYLDLRKQQRENYKFWSRIKEIKYGPDGILEKRKMLRDLLNGK